MPDESRNTVKNLIWRFLERCGAQGVTFIVSVVLARLLEPTVYGMVALVTVFTTIMQVFVDSGMGNALIQKKNADNLDFSSVFWFNIVCSAVLYTVMFFVAPLIAGFYENQELVPVIRVLGLMLFISGIKNVQQAYVSRHMMFRKFFFSTLGGTLGAAVVGIGMALAGFGVWALVSQMLFNALVDTVILWITVKWRPEFTFSLRRLRVLFSYGWKLLVSSLIATVYEDLRQLIIGKRYSSSDLAYYNKGNQFPSLIVTNVNTSIDSVLLPAMSKAQDDRERIKAMTRRAIKTSSYIMAPLMIGLAVCAEPIVRLLLTEKWLECIPFLRIFCITYLFYPIHTANLNAIKAMGRSDLFLKLEIAKKTIGVLLVLCTMWISVEAMAYSLLISTLASTVINAFPNKKLLDYSWFEQMKDILPNCGLALIMGIPVLLMGYLPLPTVIVLISQIACGALLYIGLSVLFRLEALRYLQGIIRSFIRKKKA